MTLANRLTLTRLALVPAFMCFMIVDNLTTRSIALLIFIGASITDWYDGEIARRTGTVTVVGTFLDPLVDKLLIAAALVGFVELKELHVPAWAVVLIISREFLITGLRTLAAARGIVMAADGAGKWKTASQMMAIIAILVILIMNAILQHWPNVLFATPGPRPIFFAVLDHAPYWLVMIATAVTVFSGYAYINKYRALLKKELDHRKIQS